MRKKKSSLVSSLIIPSQDSLSFFSCFILYSQGIYSCFNGVQNLESPVRVYKPDVTANSAQANVLKMLQAAKNMVSTASVENSLENATRTIENWSSRSENFQTTFSLRTPQFVVQNTSGSNRPAQSSNTTTTTEKLGRSFPPLLLAPQQTVGPASESCGETIEHPQILHPLKLRGNCSEDKIIPALAAYHSPQYVVTTSQANLRKHIGSSLSDAPHSPIRTLQELSPHNHKYKLPMSRGHGKQKFHQNDHLYKEGEQSSATQESRLAFPSEKKKNLETHPCIYNSFPKDNRTCRPFALKEYDPLELRREKETYTASLSRSTLEQHEQFHSLGLWKHPPKCSSSRDILDFFPKASLTPKAKVLPGIHHGVHHHSPDALRPSNACNRKCRQASGLSWKEKQLLHSQSTRLPVYREACLQNVSGIHRASSAVVQKQYAYVNSYPNLPVYWRSFHPGPSHLCEQSSASQHCFSQASWPPCSRDFLVHAGGQRAMYFNSTQRDCRNQSRVYPTFIQMTSTERRNTLTTPRMHSPCATRSWRRISSLESEV